MNCSLCAPAKFSPGLGKVNETTCQVSFQREIHADLHAFLLPGMCLYVCPKCLEIDVGSCIKPGVSVERNLGSW